MQTDVECLNGLIQQILTLTRLQAYGGQKIAATVNLRSILEGVAEDAGFEGKEQGKSVVIAHAYDFWMQGDPALLRSCLENVVRNAVYHTKPQTSVIIALNFRDGVNSKSAYVLVSDHGEGVPSDALPRLFEPFYRVPGVENRKSGVSGLGLSIAQRVAVLHGGCIKARNREQGGMEMEIHLPANGSAP
jgi:two-component system sensor histidine kinase CpxA